MLRFETLPTKDITRVVINTTPNTCTMLTMITLTLKFSLFIKWNVGFIPCRHAQLHYACLIFLKNRVKTMQKIKNNIFLSN